MYLWNLKSLHELEALQGLDGSELRKKLRIANWDQGRLTYVKPLRVRKGWIDSSLIIDACSTGRVYGAGDELSPLPPEVIILLREREERNK